MFKKVMYILFAALLGAIIFLITFYCSVNEEHLKQCKKAAKNDDYSYFLKFHSYYMDNPILEYEIDDFKLLIYSVFDEDATDSSKNRPGYAIVVDNINTSKIEVTNQDDTAATITFTSGENDTSWDFDLSYTDFFGLTFYELTTLELNRDLGGVIDDKGTTDDTTDDVILTAISTIDSISITDGKGTTFFRTEESFSIKLNEFSDDDFRETGLPGYTAEELGDIYLPSSVYTLVIVVMVIYLAVAAGIALFIFRKKTVIEDNTPFIPASKEDLLIESGKGDYSKIKSVYKADDMASKNEVIDHIVEEKKEVSQISEETEEIETIIDTTRTNIAASGKETVRIKVKKPSESVTIVKDRSSNPNEVIKKATEASKAATGSTSKKKSSTKK